MAEMSKLPVSAWLADPSRFPPRPKTSTVRAPAVASALPPPATLMRTLTSVASSAKVKVMNSPLLTAEFPMPRPLKIQVVHGVGTGDRHVLVGERRTRRRGQAGEAYVDGCGRGRARHKGSGDRECCDGGVH